MNQRSSEQKMKCVLGMLSYRYVWRVDARTIILDFKARKKASLANLTFSLTSRLREVVGPDTQRNGRGPAHARSWKVCVLKKRHLHEAAKRTQAKHFLFLPNHSRRRYGPNFAISHKSPFDPIQKSIGSVKLQHSVESRSFDRAPFLLDRKVFLCYRSRRARSRWANNIRRKLTSMMLILSRHPSTNTFV